MSTSTGAVVHGGGAVGFRIPVTARHAIAPSAYVTGMNDASPHKVHSPAGSTTSTASPQHQMFTPPSRGQAFIAPPTSPTKAPMMRAANAPQLPTVGGTQPQHYGMKPRTFQQQTSGALANSASSNRFGVPSAPPASASSQPVQMQPRTTQPQQNYAASPVHQGTSLAPTFGTARHSFLGQQSPHGASCGVNFGPGTKPPAPQAPPPPPAAMQASTSRKTHRAQTAFLAQREPWKLAAGGSTQWQFSGQPRMQDAVPRQDGVPATIRMPQHQLHGGMQQHQGLRSPPAHHSPTVTFDLPGASTQEQHSRVSRPRSMSLPPEGFDEALALHRTRVTVVAPGAGMHQNGKAYFALGQETLLQVEKAGASRAPYDRYPESWPNGAPAPNLKSFAEELLSQNWLDRTDILVFGSRGGQVVLPFFWQKRGSLVPPAVVINGGCGMQLPTSVSWPDEAMTFLLVGGQDNFNKGMSADAHLADIRSRVPAKNCTTAVLYVNEMTHMPQPALLEEALPRLVKSLQSWRATGVAPTVMFAEVTQALGRAGFSGQLLFKVGPGSWSADMAFAVSAARAAPGEPAVMRNFGGREMVGA
eukprot:CAMPEP_0177300062 /NCGR_PEP_ID=MMETSP0368-20130122/4356_1 /TAXON_ID=447022 ORGANISM="Scrippsiella hangoei-like, Strain SHHI-4" /NCGR_SAMPLE_ID=MMETSP0368 /ASSEMBLY_ACC=CAM_ASM_000363 /LENGTH=586 /DNA_ID=CAMNT_0018758431 /DNA_START=32 /DNA_END=1789 /DNA_ORIENTATION=-